MHEDRAFQLQVVEDLAELKTETKNIVSRLDRLNGSVARHEADLGEMKLQAAADKASTAVTRRWIEFARPAIWSVLGGLLMLALQHADKLIAAFKK
jgi:hypothetical protein